MSPIDLALLSVLDCGVIRVATPLPWQWTELAAKGWLSWKHHDGSIDFRMAPAGMSRARHASNHRPGR